MSSKVRSTKVLFMSRCAALAVFLIPFISLPVLPSVYRPVSLYFLIPLFLIYSLNFKRLLLVSDIRVIILFLFCSLYGLVHAIFGTHASIVLYLSDLTVLCVGVVVYFGFRVVFLNLGIEGFVRYSNYAFKFLVFIGIAEIMSIVGVLPMDLKEGLNLLFSEKSQTRVQLTTMEASWGARVFLFSFLVYVCSAVDRYKVIYVLAGMMIFLFIFSIGVFAFALLGLAMYCVYQYRLKGVGALIALGCCVIAIIVLSVEIFSYFGFGGYHLSRISALFSGDYYHISDMLTFDQSIFIRVGYPIVAYQVGIDNPFGIGLGQYPLYFSQYLVDTFGSSVLSFPEVLDDVVSGDGDARSLFLKVYSELSFLGLILLFWMLFRSLRERSESSYEKLKVLFFFMSIASMLTIGTWAYLYFWIAIAMMPASDKGELY